MGNRHALAAGKSDTCQFQRIFAAVHSRESLGKSKTAQFAQKIAVRWKTPATLSRSHDHSISHWIQPNYVHYQVSRGGRNERRPTHVVLGPEHLEVVGDALLVVGEALVDDAVLSVTRHVEQLRVAAVAAQQVRVRVDLLRLRVVTHHLLHVVIQRDLSRKGESLKREHRAVWWRAVQRGCWSRVLRQSSVTAIPAVRWKGPRVG